MRGASLGLLLLRKVLGAAGVLAVVAVAVFAMIHLVPGDPVDALLGESAPPAERDRLRRALHLDEPLGRQFLRFASSLADGSLGRSFRRPDRTVSEMILEVYPYTLELAAASMLVALALALPLGILAASRAGTPVDLAATGISLLGISIPNMYLGPVLLLVFYLHLGWLPGPAPANPSSPADLVLPSVTLGTALTAMLARMTRSSMVQTLASQYVRTAAAKGLSRRRILWRHALPNALVPVVTVAGLQFGSLLSGAIVTEKVFARPGIGTLLLEGIATRDYPVIQGCVLVVAATYVLVNGLTDLSYRLLDPRLRRRT